MSREAIDPQGEASDCVSHDGGSYIEPARGGNALEGEMVAYLIVEHKITDPAKFEEYRSKVGPIIAKHGGRYLSKGGSHKVLETTHWQPDRVALIEFSDMKALETWYNSPEYQPLMALRRAAVDMDKDMLITVEGV